MVADPETQWRGERSKKSTSRQSKVTATCPLRCTWFIPRFTGTLLIADAFTLCYVCLDSDEIEKLSIIFQWIIFSLLPSITLCFKYCEILLVSGQLLRLCAVLGHIFSFIDVDLERRCCRCSSICWLIYSKLCGGSGDPSVVGDKVERCLWPRLQYCDWLELRIWNGVKGEISNLLVCKWDQQVQEYQGV